MKRVLFGAGVAAAVVAALAWVRFGDASGRTGSRPIGRTDRLSRNLRLARFGSRAGAGYGLHRARKVFADAERHDALDRAYELKTADQVAGVLGEMKGAMMKIGQLASFIDQGLPDSVRASLAQLQADSPPMSHGLVEQVIRAELGDRPDRVFAEFDPEPIAAASIGQVHRAMTHDGRAVAVKVQYPTVDDAIRADLENADGIFRGLSLLFPGLDPEGVTTELRARLLEELDYGLEAANQRRFARYYRDHPFISVPGVVGEHSTQRVLTTELASGARFDEMMAWAQPERDLAAETIFRFAFGGIYRQGAFNGDPHPGNYLFEPGGRVTFLDFGLVKHFDHAALRNFEAMLTAMVIDQDEARFRQVVERLGLLHPGQGFTDAEVRDYFSHFYEFVLADGVYTITQEYASATIRHLFDPTGEYAPIRKAANVPGDFVIIQRINLGLYAIFGQLNATANWRGIAEELWPWIDRQPSTRMGEALVGWRETVRPLEVRYRELSA